MNKVASLTFNSALSRQGSWGSTDIDGRHESTMDLYLRDDAHGFIEWDIPSIDETEEIGLSFEVIDGRATLTDYDGVMCLPAQACDLMRASGIVVPDEFDERIKVPKVMSVVFNNDAPMMVVRNPKDLQDALKLVERSELQRLEYAYGKEQAARDFGLRCYIHHHDVEVI